MKVSEFTDKVIEHLKLLKTGTGKGEVDFDSSAIEMTDELAEKIRIEHLQNRYVNDKRSMLNHLARLIEELRKDVEMSENDEIVSLEDGISHSFGVF